MQVATILLCLCALVATVSAQSGGGMATTADTTASLLTATQLANTMTSAMKAAPAKAPADLPIVTLSKNVNASNTGTGKNLAAISNYYTKLAINDNNFLRERGYLLSEAGLALSTGKVDIHLLDAMQNIGVSLGGFLASIITLTKDAIQVLGSAFGITTASIALLRALPAGPTAGVTSAQISANLAANGRRLQQGDDESTATFVAFSKAQLANGTVQDVYSSVQQNMARLDLIQSAFDTIQSILSDPTKALDGLSPATNVVNPYSDSKLQELGMTRVGRSIVKATTPLFFTADQLAQNQSNYNLLKSIPTILSYPPALPGQPNFIGTGLTPAQSSNLAFFATVLNLVTAIAGELANVLATLSDTITFLLRFPGLAIQIAQLEISAVLFESTLERDFTPGGAAYSDLQRFLIGVDGYRKSLGQGSLQSTVTAANKQLTTARNLLASTIA